MRRKILLGLLAVVGVLAVWLGRPIDRAALAITAANSSPAVCQRPDLPDLIDQQAGQGACKDPNGCSNSTRVARTFLPLAFASLAAYGQEKRFLPERLDTSWQRIERQDKSWSGLAYDVYERTPATGPVVVLVAFRGTEKVLKYLPSPTDVIGDLSVVTQFVNP